MTKYQKKPIVIEAVVFIYTPKGIKELHSFCGDALGHTSKQRHLGAKGEAHIITLEDGSENQVRHIATEGDYIIRGISGEFYPCKPDIFHKTYTEVTND